MKDRYSKCDTSLKKYKEYFCPKDYVTDLDEGIIHKDDKYGGFQMATLISSVYQKYLFFGFCRFLKYNPFNSSAKLFKLSDERCIDL